jgi:hypothetical protein
MNKYSSKTKLDIDDSTTIGSNLDNTEKSLSILSREFKKVVRFKTTAVRKAVKAMLTSEMANINENAERLIHGKA